MRWPRPRPLIGDTTSSAERAAGPSGWALPAATRDALADVIGRRRDVRRFRPDPVGADLVTEVLAAGHAAPSVGHSQPWRFLVVRDPAVRARAGVLADRARLAQAGMMDPDSARHLRGLQLDGIREAPVGIVVCCDRRARPAGVLGRATFPDADLWSCACAIENIWLTARALGLGLGWVTLFDPADLAGLLGLPDGVVTLGWLCLGWPDERPPAPGLERQGWSRRVPLADVVAADRWPAEAPAAPRDRSALAGRADPGEPASLPAAAPAARVGTRDDEDRLLAAPGSLGLLGDLLLRAGSLARPGGSAALDDGPGTLLIAAADHPVTALGVSAFPASTTRLVAAALAAGEGQGAAMAAAAGAATWLADCGIDGPPVPGWHDRRPSGPRGDLAGSDALTAGDVAGLLAAGEQAGRDLAGRGPVALGEVGIGNTTVAAALAAALLGAAPGQVAGRGAGSDTAIVARKEQVIGAGAGPDGRPAAARRAAGPGRADRPAGRAGRAGARVPGRRLPGRGGGRRAGRPRRAGHLGQRAGRRGVPARGAGSPDRGPAQRRAGAPDGARRARPGAAAGRAAAGRRGGGRGPGAEPAPPGGTGPARAPPLLNRTGVTG